MAVRNAADRKSLWIEQCALMTEEAEARGIDVLPPPARALSNSGFLAEEFRSEDPCAGQPSRPPQDR